MKRGTDLSNPTKRGTTMFSSTCRKSRRKRTSRAVVWCHTGPVSIRSKRVILPPAWMSLARTKIKEIANRKVPTTMTNAHRTKNATSIPSSRTERMVTTNKLQHKVSTVCAKVCVCVLYSWGYMRSKIWEYRAWCKSVRRTLCRVSCAQSMITC